ncbi:hypothetical protein KCP71_05150 [Salmonella enterica subsp. enterica]|nr:hypothetical protein KCP71_05150 [Salmonella enterica subsp. enterica]
MRTHAAVLRRKLSIGRTTRFGDVDDADLRQLTSSRSPPAVVREVTAFDIAARFLFNLLPQGYASLPAGYYFQRRRKGAKYGSPWEKKRVWKY